MFRDTGVTSLCAVMPVLTSPCVVMVCRRYFMCRGGGADLIVFVVMVVSTSLYVTLWSYRRHCVSLRGGVDVIVCITMVVSTSLRVCLSIMWC